MELGYEPDDLTVHLVTGADFLCTLILNEAWPTGATLVLDFGGSTWQASLSGREASFAEDKTVADTIADGAAVTLRYTETDGTEQTWAIGTVKRHD